MIRNGRSNYEDYLAPRSFRVTGPGGGAGVGEVVSHLLGAVMGELVVDDGLEDVEWEVLDALPPSVALDLEARPAEWWAADDGDRVVWSIRVRTADGGDVLSRGRVRVRLSTTLDPPTLGPGDVLARPLVVGTSVVVPLVLGPDQCTSHVGRPVLRTPTMVLLMEQAARDIVRPALQAGFTTVGAHIEVDHLAAALQGEEVQVSARLLGGRGRRFRHRVDVHVADRHVGGGWHENHVVTHRGGADG